MNTMNEAKTIAVEETKDDVLTFSIPRKITFELPSSISFKIPDFEIPNWVRYAAIGGGGLILLSFLTGGAIWHFWWMIFFIMPWVCGKGFMYGGTSGRMGKHGWHGFHGCGWGGDASKTESKPETKSEMYV